MVKRTVSVVLLIGTLALLSASSGLASSAAPGWDVAARTFPTYLAPGVKGAIEVRVVNIGAANSKGVVTIIDDLPAGVVATGAGSFDGLKNVINGYFEDEQWDCGGNGPGEAVAGATVVTCTSDPIHLPHILAGGGVPTRGTNVLAEIPESNGDPDLGIGVEVPSGTAEGTRTGAQANRVTVTGGGASVGASESEPVTISSSAPAFGFSGADMWFSNADGTFDTQAGSHPYEASFEFDMNNVAKNPEYGPVGGEPRNLTFRLPSGFVGDPSAVAQCPRALFVTETKCPPSTQVGELISKFLGDAELSPTPVFNLVPEPGEPAEFGFVINGNLTIVDTEVRSGSDYGITSITNNITRTRLVGAVLTLWGEPSDPSHAPWRCEKPLFEEYQCGVKVAQTHKPFLTLPTSCVGPQVISLRVNAWEDPTEFAATSFSTHDGNGEPVGFTGCEDLDFGPTITTSPDTAKADTPAGLTVEVKPLLGGLQDGEGLSTADIQDTTVALPRGLVINPGQAAGLQSCGPAEDGLTTEAEKAEGKEDNGPPDCPSASRVGAVIIKSPLIEDASEKQFEGNVYVLRSNPPELKLLVAASADGVNLKLVGIVHLDEQTGQLVTTFAGTPALPFTDLKLAFSGGAQAALATPTQCGSYGAAQGFAADFAPWASPFVADVFSTASFQITSGNGNAPCPPSPLPFTPSLIAGSTTDQAGGFTDFSLLLQAPDDQQRIERLQFKVPEGLLGMIGKVPLCTNAQAEANACSAASQIGHTVVASGPGPYPLVVPEPGQPPAPIYLTESYDGAPYGLSIVVPLHVGPFVLPTQRVRAKIEVDPLTAQITVTTNQFPQVVAGVPTDLRTIDAVVDRREFMFNPTSCSAMSFSGTAWGTPPPGSGGGSGAAAPISSHFQMGSCRSLLFKPNFKVSTSGKTSRKNGASLDAKIIYPRGPLGANQASSQSNLKSVKVDLPKQLPSRLTTLQKACTSQVFEANPANCPADSRVGTASAITPVLPVELTGPAYFVSYGGAKFPELVFALQGYGVTIYVHGETFINKAGITSSTFHRVPDVPIYQFELKLPQGPFSALAANGNLCKTHLKMPTSFTAQDGAVIHQTTPITVTNCVKHKTKKAAKHTRKGKRRK
ncbi:MAG: hypothetical protein WBV85_13495 [Solirubrobacteraceae bacterium]